MPSPGHPRPRPAGECALPRLRPCGGEIAGVRGALQPASGTSLGKAGREARGTRERGPGPRECKGRCGPADTASGFREAPAELAGAPACGDWSRPQAGGAGPTPWVGGWMGSPVFRCTGGGAPRAEAWRRGPADSVWGGAPGPAPPFPGRGALRPRRMEVGGPQNQWPQRKAVMSLRPQGQRSPPPLFLTRPGAGRTHHAVRNPSSPPGLLDV